MLKTLWWPTNSRNPYNATSVSLEPLMSLAHLTELDLAGWDFAAFTSPNIFHSLNKIERLKLGAYVERITVGFTENSLKIHWILLGRKFLSIIASISLLSYLFLFRKWGFPILTKIHENRTVTGVYRTYVQLPTHSLRHLTHLEDITLSGCSFNYQSLKHTIFGGHVPIRSLNLMRCEIPPNEFPVFTMIPTLRSFSSSCALSSSELSALEHMMYVLGAPLYRLLR